MCRHSARKADRDGAIRASGSRACNRKVHARAAHSVVLGQSVADITLSPVTDFAALGERWRALEARAECSFFQTWTWTGCLAEERFPDPVVLEAREAGTTVALALFNRRRGLRETLLLGETGDGLHDTPFIEHNGILLASDATPDLAAECLRAARTLPIGPRRPFRKRRLILSGVGADTLLAARTAGSVRLRRRSGAPVVDLGRLRRDGRNYLELLSANTRYQLRRSDRSYAAAGPAMIRRAATLPEAHAWLDALAVLHQATWKQRGALGAFGAPFFARFHHALIDRGLDRGEIDLMRISSGEHLVGFLYNFRHRDRSLAYQSGFDYAGAGRHQKPGLTCHHLAILSCLADGLISYDFLAGEDRYKRSLADQEVPLHWIEIGTGRVDAVRNRLAELTRRAARWRHQDAISKM